MDKTNIFLFWLGNQEIKNKVIKKVKEIEKKIPNIKIEIGPTDTEHEFLLNNSRYYNFAFSNKKYAFCSDVYRIYKLSISDGWYLDSMFLFDINLHKFKLLLDEVKKYDLLLIRENHIFFYNGIIFSKNNQEFFSRILKFYSNRIYDKVLSGPVILTYHINKHKKMLNNKKVLIKDCSIFDYYNSESIFKYNGLSSWNNSNTDQARMYFHSNANRLLKKPNIDDKINKFIFLNILWSKYCLLPSYLFLKKVIFFIIRIFRK